MEESLWSSEHFVAGFTEMQACLENISNNSGQIGVERRKEIRAKDEQEGT